jgi:hypothetical protein
METAHNAHYSVRPQITDPDMMPPQADTWPRREEARFDPLVSGVTTAKSQFQSHKFTIIIAIVVILIVLIVLFMYLTRRGGKKAADPPIESGAAPPPDETVDLEELARLRAVRRQVRAGADPNAGPAITAMAAIAAPAQPPAPPAPPTVKFAEEVQVLNREQLAPPPWAGRPEHSIAPAPAPAPAAAEAYAQEIFGAPPGQLGAPHEAHNSTDEEMDSLIQSLSEESDSSKQPEGTHE